MSTSIKTISDDLITQIATCTRLDKSRVKSFSGTPEMFAESSNRIPFCGVALDGIEFDEDTASVDRSIVEEHLRFKLIIIASDLRGESYSMEDCYELLDTILAKITGLDLDIDGLSPWIPVSLDKHEALEASGKTVYMLIVSAWQTRQ